MAGGWLARTPSRSRSRASTAAAASAHDPSASEQQQQQPPALPALPRSATASFDIPPPSLLSSAASAAPPQSVATVAQRREQHQPGQLPLGAAPSRIAHARPQSTDMGPTPSSSSSSSRLPHLAPPSLVSASGTEIKEQSESSIAALYPSPSARARASEHWLDPAYSASSLQHTRFVTPSASAPANLSALGGEARRRSSFATAAGTNSTASPPQDARVIARRRRRKARQPKTVNVLLIGQSATGKSSLARTMATQLVRRHYAATTTGGDGSMMPSRTRTRTRTRSASQPEQDASTTTTTAAAAAERAFASTLMRLDDDIPDARDGKEGQKQDTKAKVGAEALDAFIPLVPSRPPRRRQAQQARASPSSIHRGQPRPTKAIECLTFDTLAFDSDLGESGTADSDSDAEVRPPVATLASSSTTHGHTAAARGEPSSAFAAARRDGKVEQGSRARSTSATSLSGGNNNHPATALLLSDALTTVSLIDTPGWSATIRTPSPAARADIRAQQRDAQGHHARVVDACLALAEARFLATLKAEQRVDRRTRDTAAGSGSGGGSEAHIHAAVYLIHHASISPRHSVATARDDPARKDGARERANGGTRAASGSGDEEHEDDDGEYAEEGDEEEEHVAEVDLQNIARLSERMCVVPVLARTDELTSSRVRELKRVVRADVRATLRHGYYDGGGESVFGAARLNPLLFPDQALNEDEDEDAPSATEEDEDEGADDGPPYAVCAPEHMPDFDTPRSALTREYNFGTLAVLSARHTDVRQLERALLARVEGRDALRTATKSLYERWRAQILE